MIRTTAVIFLAGLSLCACSTPPQSQAISPNLDSGITASNGGGTRALGNTNSQQITPGGTVSGNNNSVGRAY